MSRFSNRLKAHKPSAGLRVAIDIDGVLADFSPRYSVAQAGLIDEFYNLVIGDKPITAGIVLFKTFIKAHDVWLVSGRPESTRKDTIAWLRHNVLFDPYSKDWYAESADWIRLRQSLDQNYITFKVEEIDDIGFVDLVIDDDPAICRAVEEKLHIPTLLFKQPDLDLVSWWSNMSPTKSQAEIIEEAFHDEEDCGCGKHNHGSGKGSDGSTEG